MRCTIGTALVCVAATVATLQAQDLLGGPRDLNRRGEGVNRLERWVDFVQSHRGGIPDEATRQLESGTAANLEELTIDLPSLLKLMDDPRGDEFSVWIEGGGRNAGRRRVVYSGSELDRLRRMARGIGGRVPQAAPAPREEGRILAAQNRLLKAAPPCTPRLRSRVRNRPTRLHRVARSHGGKASSDSTTAASSASITDRINGNSRAGCSTW